MPETEIKGKPGAAESDARNHWFYMEVAMNQGDFPTSKHQKSAICAHDAARPTSPAQVFSLGRQSFKRAAFQILDRAARFQLLPKALIKTVREFRR